MYTRVCISVYICMIRPEVSQRCLFHYLSTIFLRQGLTEPEALQFSRLASQRTLGILSPPP